MTIEMEGITIDATIKQVKTLRLYVTRSGEAKLTIPSTMSSQEVYEFVHKNIEWLKENIARSIEHLQEEKEMLIHNMTEGEAFHYLGQKLKLHYEQYDGPIKVEISDGQLIVSSNRPLAPEQAKIIISNWYADNLKRIIKDYLEYWLPIMFERPLTKVVLKNWKSRWATMQPTKRIASFNIRLIFYPLQAIETIVVHELCHLKEPSHNAYFHHLMAYYLPNYKEGEALLKRK